VTGALDTGTAARDRTLLVELCVDMHDRISSAGLRDKVKLGLGRVGVDLISADGEPFDPEAHQALGEVETVDPALEGMVAATQRTGYRDHGRLAREPAVLVYRLAHDGRGS
jgi:molecular chaperone GrpE (heat shock protein)